MNPSPRRASCSVPDLFNREGARIARNIIFNREHSVTIPAALRLGVEGLVLCKHLDAKSSTSVATVLIAISFLFIRRFLLRVKFDNSLRSL